MLKNFRLSEWWSEANEWIVKPLAANVIHSVNPLSISSQIYSCEILSSDLMAFVSWSLSSSLWILRQHSSHSCCCRFESHANVGESNKPLRSTGRRWVLVSFSGWRRLKRRVVTNCTLDICTDTSLPVISRIMSQLNIKHILIIVYSTQSAIKIIYCHKLSGYERFTPISGISIRSSPQYTNTQRSIIIKW